MKSLCYFLIALMGTSAAAAAAPSFGDADAWRRDLRGAIESNQSALLKKGPAIPAQARRWAQLNERAQSLFGDDVMGPFGPCLSAAAGGQSFWQDMASAVTRPSADPILVGGIGRFAFESGAHYWACRAAVDALDAKSRSVRAKQ